MFGKKVGGLGQIIFKWPFKNNFSSLETAIFYHGHSKSETIKGILNPKEDISRHNMEEDLKPENYF